MNMASKCTIMSEVQLNLSSSALSDDNDDRTDLKRAEWPRALSGSSIRRKKLRAFQWSPSMMSTSLKGGPSSRHTLSLTLHGTRGVTITARAALCTPSLNTVSAVAASNTFAHSVVTPASAVDPPTLPWTLFVLFWGYPPIIDDDDDDDDDETPTSDWQTLEKWQRKRSASKLPQLTAASSNDR